MTLIPPAGDALVSRGELYLDAVSAQLDRGVESPALNLILVCASPKERLTPFSAVRFSFDRGHLAVAAAVGHDVQAEGEGLGP